MLLVVLENILTKHKHPLAYLKSMEKQSQLPQPEITQDKA